MIFLGRWSQTIIYPTNKPLICLGRRCQILEDSRNSPTCCSLDCTHLRKTKLMQIKTTKTYSTKSQFVFGNGQYVSEHFSQPMHFVLCNSYFVWKACLTSAISLCLTSLSLPLHLMPPNKGDCHHLQER